MRSFGIVVLHERVGDLTDLLDRSRSMQKLALVLVGAMQSFHVAVLVWSMRRADIG